MQRSSELIAPKSTDAFGVGEIPMAFRPAIVQAWQSLRCCVSSLMSSLPLIAESTSLGVSLPGFMSTKIFVDKIRNRSYLASYQERAHDHRQTDTATDRRRAGHPERAVGARPEQRPRRPRRAQLRAEHRLYDRPQAVTDHDRKGTGRARRVGTGSHLRGPVQRATNAASASGGFDGARLR